MLTCATSYEVGLHQDQIVLQGISICSEMWGLPHILDFSGFYVFYYNTAVLTSYENYV